MAFLLIANPNLNFAFVFFVLRVLKTPNDGAETIKNYAFSQLSFWASNKLYEHSNSFLARLNKPRKANSHSHMSTCPKNQLLPADLSVFLLGQMLQTLPWLRC